MTNRPKANTQFNEIEVQPNNSEMSIYFCYSNFVFFVRDFNPPDNRDDTAGC